MGFYSEEDVARGYTKCPHSLGDKHCGVPRDMILEGADDTCGGLLVDCSWWHGSVGRFGGHVIPGTKMAAVAASTIPSIEVIHE